LRQKVSRALSGQGIVEVSPDDHDLTVNGVEGAGRRDALHVDGDPGRAAFLEQLLSGRVQVGRRSE
jgi:hypothetical protein